MTGRCRHVWKIVQRDEQPAGLEIARAAGMRVKTLGGQQWIVRPVIVEYRCEKCGSEKVERV